MKVRIVDRNDPDATPIRRFRSTCLGEISERMDPDADFKNRYPRTCYYNSYALGSVSGIPAGWASSIFGYESGLRLAPGKYDLTASITKGYADALGLNAAQRTASTVLTVGEPERLPGLPR